MTYEEYNKLSKEQKSAYHEEFYNLKESCHNLKLEKFLNSTDVLKSLELDICDEMFYLNPLDFEIEWVNSLNIDNYFSHRMSLKYMFKNNFTYAILNENSTLYKYLSNTSRYGRHRVLRSPETNIVENNRRQLVIFCEDKNLYCYVGCAYYRNFNANYFDYLGKIL